MVKPVRRVVAGNDDRGVAVALSDGPSPDDDDAYSERREHEPANPDGSHDSHNPL